MKKDSSPRGLFRPFLWAGMAAFLILPNLPSQGAPKGSPARREKRGGTPKERFQRYLTKDFIKEGGWVMDYDEARARAQREGKLIFVYFSRTYAP